MQPPLYNPNVPENPSDTLATSQRDILNNFGQLFNNFLKNHVSIDQTGAGNHTIIQLVEQESAVQTDNSEINVYSKDIEESTDQVFLRYQGNGQEFAYTCYQIYGLTPTDSQISYFTFLPGRILVYFGSFSTLPNNTLSLYPPIATKIFSVSLCPIGSTPNYKPNVKLEKDNKNFFSRVVMFPVIEGRTLPQCYYIIMANI